MAMLCVLLAAWQPYRSLGCYYMWRIPLPARQNSKASNKGKGKASGKAQQQLSRPPAPAFPLGGAVPALADVGVNPLAPILAATSQSMAAALAAAAAAAAESEADAGNLQVAPSAADVLQPAATSLGEQHLPDLQPTPVKPLAAQLEQAVGVAAGGKQDPVQLQQQQLGAGAMYAASHAASADAGTIGGAAEHAGQPSEPATGVMTRRQLRWAQQAAGSQAEAQAGATASAVNTGASSAQHAPGQLRARVVDL